MEGFREERRKWIALGVFALIAAGVGFVIRQRRARVPLYDLAVAGRRVFWVAACAGIIVFGSLMGTPIINQPQVAILGVGAIEKRPKVLPGADGEDTIAIRTCAYFSISFDHRVIDGAIADQFLAFVKKTIETFPETGL